MSKSWGVLSLLLFLLLFLVVPASASSIRLDDPIAEVYYDVISPDGSVYQSNLNSSDICNLSDGHYTILLHSEPLRAVSDPGSFYGNLVNYGYALLFVCVLVFIAGGFSGVFLGQFIRRRA